MTQRTAQAIQIVEHIPNASLMELATALAIIRLLNRTSKATASLALCAYR